MTQNYRTSKQFLFLPWFLLAAVVVPPASAVYAQNAAPESTAATDAGDEEAQAEKHFDAGRKLKEAGKLDEAIVELQKAYELRPAPPLLLYIAQTYERQGDKKNALRYYKEFLQKARVVDPQRPTVEGVVKDLEKEVGGGVGTVTTTDGVETPAAREREGASTVPGARRQQLIHTPIDSVKVHTKLTVMAELPPDVQIDRMTLYYRRSGETAFREAEMVSQGEAYVGEIPAHHVTSSSIQYFIAALKGAGKHTIVAEAGSKTTPLIVVIEGGISAFAYKQAQEKDIRSPYRTWIWVAGGASVAMFGVSLSTFILAKDRQSAMERWVDEKSCVGACKDNGIPQLTFGDSGGKVQNWESEGKAFSAISGVCLGVGIVGVAATGYLYFMDRKWIREERKRLLTASRSGSQLVALPFAGRDTVGLTGTFSF